MYFNSTRICKHSCADNRHPSAQQWCLFQIYCQCAACKIIKAPGQTTKEISFTISRPEKEDHITWLVPFQFQSVHRAFKTITTSELHKIYHGVSRQGCEYLTCVYSYTSTLGWKCKHCQVQITIAFVMIENSQQCVSHGNKSLVVTQLWVCVFKFREVFHKKNFLWCFPKFSEAMPMVYEACVVFYTFCVGQREWVCVCFIIEGQTCMTTVLSEYIPWKTKVSHCYVYSSLFGGLQLQNTKGRLFAENSAWEGNSSQTVNT